MIEINGVTSGVTGGGLVSEEKGDKMGEGQRRWCQEGGWKERV